MTVVRPDRTLKPVSKTLWKYYFLSDQPTGKGGEIERAHLMQYDGLNDRRNEHQKRKRETNQWSRSLVK